MSANGPTIIIKSLRGRERERERRRKRARKEVGCRISGLLNEAMNPSHVEIERGSMVTIASLLSCKAFGGLGMRMLQCAFIT